MTDAANDAQLVRDGERSGKAFLSLTASLILLFASASALSHSTVVAQVEPGDNGGRCDVISPTPEELCNVDGGLKDAFTLAERIAAAANPSSGERLGAVVRERQVRVEWYPDSAPLRAGVMGVYRSGDRIIWMAPGLRNEPLRARASILAHELAHASWDLDALGNGLAPVQACMNNEVRAYRWGLIVYEQAIRETGEPEQPNGESDKYLAEQLDRWRRGSGGSQLKPEALDDLARNFLFQNGYADRCAWA
ncbi:MAG: hypothetical protein ACKVVP_10970 [Chloroflexota bacterium]